MIALISIRLTSLVDRARDRRKAYTDRNDIRQQVILDLYESHIALAETVKEMAEVLVVSEQNAEQTAEALVRLTKQTVEIADHLLAQQGMRPSQAMPQQLGEWKGEKS